MNLSVRSCAIVTHLLTYSPGGTDGRYSSRRMNEQITTDFFLCSVLYMYSAYVFNAWVARISGASAPLVLPVTPYQCFSFVLVYLHLYVWLWQIYWLIDWFYSAPSIVIYSFVYNTLSTINWPWNEKYWQVGGVADRGFVYRPRTNNVSIACFLIELQQPCKSFILQENGA